MLLKNMRQDNLDPKELSLELVRKLDVITFHYISKIAIRGIMLEWVELLRRLAQSKAIPISKYC